MNENLIKERLLDGETVNSLAREFNVCNEQISTLKKSMSLPSAKIINKLKLHPEFKDFFILTYNSTDNVSHIISEIQKHPLFLKKKICNRRLNELRSLYGLKCKMPENKYYNQYDRIRGYMIRNAKFMSGRRNIYFNLKYTDFEIPEYCPILNIKLTYMSESNGNDPSHATIDRIDNSIGYVKGNVIVISRLANSMKNCASFKEINLFCTNMKKLIDYYKNQGALGSITDVFDNFSPKLSLDY